MVLLMRLPGSRLRKRMGLRSVRYCVRARGRPNPTIRHQTLLSGLASDYNSAPIERTCKYLESDWGGVVSDGLKRFSGIGLGLALALVAFALAGPLWGQGKVTPGDLTT